MELWLEIPEINKKIFKSKPMKSNGLLLQVQHTLYNKRTRFTHSCFNQFHNILGLANNQGNIYIIDYSINKYWGIQQSRPCTFIEFSPLNDFHILTGIHIGDIIIYNIHSGQICGKLTGHKYNVQNVSFSKNYMLTASTYEAIIWNLESFTKMQVLNLEQECTLKYVAFIPVSGNVLACYQDDLIQIWSHDIYKNLKQFSPTNWKNCSIKSISFTKNGQIMVVAGQSPKLSLFHLETFKHLKTISLADHLQTIRCTEFVSRPYDGGNNNILIVLSGQGILYFLNIEESTILNELQCEMEIHRFVCSSNGNYIVCQLTSGEVLLFNIQQYLTSTIEIRVQKVPKKFKPNTKKSLGEIRLVKNEIDNLLDIKKLRSILEEYGEFPDIYRTMIWERLLDLPNNSYEYSSIINHVTIISFENLYQKYPLEDKMFLRSLKKLLNNIVTWCPFFANIEYLPVFAFPFVKVFNNKPLVCFEAVCTVIMNWCQHWFEYFPLLPINVLAIAENILLEHDPELLHHFVTFRITSNIYIWALLETIFSEVLTSMEWLSLWDHILINEVSFLLCATVAYNIIQRHNILSLKTLEDFEDFFKNQNPIDLKKLIKVTYCILEKTSEQFHSRQYFKNFVSIEKSKYPIFIDYPRKIIEYEKQEENELDEHILKLLAEQKIQNNKKKMIIYDVIIDEMKKEEGRRLKEMEKIYSNQIKLKQQIFTKEKLKLQNTKKICEANTEDASEQCDKRRGSDKMHNDHQKKLEILIDAEILDKLINKVENELQNRNQPIEYVENKHKRFKKKEINNSKLRTSGIRYDAQDCLCEVVCPKTVRFGESTTGSSVY
ncbi:TBC1 domain family member 31 isoform X1 [Diorhabda sublineata]|uniref:TBC1 domain family member 31 isoform X1 n=1 Tax=Diorhabda sublineata TaxID=1163346 RepID=UPI0024E17335|nr:TBC1 domain family member 31 isoform X1 [Diorhabda sublineata]